MDCILLAKPCVAHTIERRARKDAMCSAGLAGFALLVLSRFAAPVFAQAADPNPGPPPHVRPSADLQALVEEATVRSPVIRALRAQLETLDVTVYIRARAFTQIDLDGRVALLAVNGHHRYLVIELSCSRSTIAQMSTLGHELFHAVEIASEPSVVDARSMAAFYARIGQQTSDSIGRQTFETEAAANAGQRARRELLMHTTRNSNGS